MGTLEKVERKWPVWLKHLAILTSIFCLGVLLLTLYHKEAFTFLADIWIVDDAPIQKVDALIIPGGGFETRPFGAAKLYEQGISQQIITFRTEVSPREKLGLTLPHHETNIRALTAAGIPRTAITVIGNHVASTQDEALATAQWCTDNKIQSVAILTEYLVSRRTAWAFKKRLSKSKVTVHIAALEHHPFKIKEWWLDEDGVITFQNELIKYLYYRLRY